MREYLEMVDKEEKMIQSLVESPRFALTTLAKDDWQYADRLQTASVRGENELLYWGVGPELERGDIVGLYTPKSLFLPPSDRSVLKRVYSVATSTTPGTHWNNHVFLYRRITIEPPLMFKDLAQEVGLSWREIASAGKLRKPWSAERSKSFWKLAFRGRSNLASRVSRRLLRNTGDDVSISYAGEDWTQAYRLMLWCEDANLNAFFVTSVGSVLPVEEKPLEILLGQVFARTSIALFLVPRDTAMSKWIRLELDAALSNARSILLVRTDSKRSWPMEQREGVRRLDLKPAQEGRIIAKLMELLQRTTV